MNFSAKAYRSVMPRYWGDLCNDSSEVVSPYDEIKTFSSLLVLPRSFPECHECNRCNLLVAVNFGPDFYRWTATLYNGTCMRIILTNWITERIFLQGGAKQGYTLSPLIHVLCIEVLANLIQDSPNI